MENQWQSKCNFVCHLSLRYASILKIKGKSFQHQKFRLRTVRPFLLEDTVLCNVRDLNPLKPESVFSFLTSKVDDMIALALEEWEQANDVHPNDSSIARPLPLIRLKVCLLEFVKLLWLPCYLELLIESMLFELFHIDPFTPSMPNSLVEPIITRGRWSTATNSTLSTPNDSGSNLSIELPT